MNEERDKFLTEQMGECWHEAICYYEEQWPYSLTYECSCGYRWDQKDRDKVNFNFSSWEGFGKLWEWAQTKYWFKEIPFNFDDNRYHDCYMLFPVEFINPNEFANAIYSYLKDRQETNI